MNDLIEILNKDLTERQKVLAIYKLIQINNDLAENSVKAICLIYCNIVDDLDTKTFCLNRLTQILEIPSLVNNQKIINLILNAITTEDKDPYTKFIMNGELLTLHYKTKR
jgi:hypothetical protein